MWMNNRRPEANIKLKRGDSDVGDFMMVTDFKIL